LIDEEKIIINIADEGIGIPDDEIEAINKPFKRASNVRFIGGYGIGLSLVSKIIEIHHASLKIFSKLNEGTRFEFSFSRRKDQDTCRP
jgi:two-component system phosphate regulon sensor histidine kinase PhoR